MSSIINKLIVLKMNKNWKVVGSSTVGKAICDLAAGINCEALDISYEVDQNGDPFGDPISIETVGWDKWITLPIRSYDFTVSYANGTKLLRAPTVLIAKKYDKVAKKSFKGKPSNDSLWQRDGGIDQYTGKPLRREDATKDHIIPKSKGGGDTWENLVITHKEINAAKGNKSNEEANLKLIKPPKAPESVPISMLIREPKHRDWRPFLMKK